MNIKMQKGFILVEVIVVILILFTLISIPIIKKLEESSIEIITKMNDKLKSIDIKLKDVIVYVGELEKENDSLKMEIEKSKKDCSTEPIYIANIQAIMV